VKSGVSIWFIEDQTPGYKLQWKVKEVLYQEQTKYQHLQVVELEDFGRTLILDGAIQITEKDEFIYNEMISHVSLITHPNPQKVLIIGGGDGGAAREVLKHKEVEEVHLVEIDNGVIDAITRFFPNLGRSFNEKRLELFVEDGLKFVSTKEGEYDVIIVDSSDPVGPAIKLFEYPFYKDCFRALKQDGILNVQSESPFFNQDIMKKVNKALDIDFKHVDTYLACVPTYPSGLWSFTMASKKYRYCDARLDKAIGLNTRYFSKAIFQSCFALPEFVKGFLQQNHY
jgi:spermidine synthase